MKKSTDQMILAILSKLGEPFFVSTFYSTKEAFELLIKFLVLNIFAIANVARVGHDLAHWYHFFIC
jgi:hypothetical protein